MDKINDYVKIGVTFIGTSFTWLFGTWDKALMVLCLFIVMDYFSGLIKGILTKTLSSDVGLHGIARKGIIFFVLAIAVALDRLMNNEAWVFRTMVCWFYTANEGISILENVTQAGLPVPQFIKDFLIQIKDKNDKGDVKDV